MHKIKASAWCILLVYGFKAGLSYPPHSEMPNLMVAKSFFAEKNGQKQKNQRTFLIFPPFTFFVFESEKKKKKGMDAQFPGKRFLRK